MLTQIKFGTSGWRAVMAEEFTFANVLRSLGIGRGDRVFVLSGRVPALYIAVLGSLKNNSVACTLFSAFGPGPIRERGSMGRPMPGVEATSGSGTSIMSGPARRCRADPTPPRRSPVGPGPP